MRIFLEKLNTFSTKLEEMMLAFGIIGIAVMSIANAISRKVFHYSWSSTEEVIQFLLVFVTFMGISYAARRGRHIRMTAFVEFMPKSVQKAIVLFACLLTAAIMFYLAKYAITYVHNTYTLGRVTPALRIPFWLTIIWVPLGFILAGIQYLRAFYKNLIEKDVWVSAEVASEYTDEYIGGGENR
jgi:TRAP-type C4-dicarboxylate transport system permease small subunit